jgi:hypothetical protein
MSLDIRQLVHFATLAPSGHNTQPWQFSVDTDTVRIFPDFSRRLPAVDPDDHALYISLGCALETLVITAAARQLEAAVEYFPPDEAEACLRVRLAPGGEAQALDLCNAIPERQSNRRRYDGRPIAESDVGRLLAANTFDAVELRVMHTATQEAEPLIAMVREGNIAQFNDPAFVAELVSWIRFSRREALATGDGLTSAALGFPSIPRWLGRYIMTKLVKPAGEAAKQDKAIRSSALLMLFIAQQHDTRHWVDVGRSFQRIALTATSMGIAHAHVNMPCEVVAIRHRLASHLGLAAGAQPLLLLRFGYAKRLPHAPRRPVEQVLRI